MSSELCVGGRPVTADPMSEYANNSVSHAASPAPNMLDFNVRPIETVAKLKARVDIGDFVSRYVKLKRSGHVYMGLCPFHTERTPSFQVSPRWQNFKCWGSSVARYRSPRPGLCHRGHSTARPARAAVAGTSGAASPTAAQ